MSFFSGYVLGQAMSGKNNSGGAGAGFFGLFAIALTLLLIGTTIASFLLPLYSILHFAIWAYQVGGGFGAFCVAVSQLVLVLTAYALALLGSRKQFYFGGIVLSLISFAVLISLSAFDGTPLHEFKDLYEDGELVEKALIGAGLCAVLVCGMRFLLMKIVSLPRRERIVLKTLHPTKWLASSKMIAWLVFVLISLSLYFRGWAIWDDHNRIYHFMELTGRTYEEGFNFVYYADKFEREMTGLAVMCVLALIATIHLVRLIRRKHTA